MNSSTLPDDGETPNADRTMSGPEPVLTFREGRPSQDLASLQSELSAISQRQDELIELVGALQGQRGGHPSGHSNDEGARMDLPRSSIPTTRPAGGAIVGPPVSNCGHVHMPEQPHRIPPHHYPVGPSYPATQQTIRQSQVQGPGQPVYHHVVRGSAPYPVLPSSIPVFGPLHDRTGQVVGLVHHGSFTLRSGANSSVRQALPPVYPPTQSQPSHRVQPQIATAQSQVPMVRRTVSGGPPPPYPGFVPVPGEYPRRASQTGPSLMQTRAGRIFEDDDDRSDVYHIPGRERAGSDPTRANSLRRIRPKQLPEFD